MSTILPDTGCSGTATSISTAWTAHCWASTRRDGPTASRPATCRCTSGSGCCGEAGATTSSRPGKRSTPTAWARPSTTGPTPRSTSPTATNPPPPNRTARSSRPTQETPRRPWTTPNSATTPAPWEGSRRQICLDWEQRVQSLRVGTAMPMSRTIRRTSTTRRGN